MESLQKIKHRINSVNSTKKITKAMELVATAKFAKIKNQFENINNYYQSVERVFLNLIKNSDQNIDELLNSASWKFKSKRNLYIVFGSDLGLCGPYNSEMYKKITQTVGKEDILIVVGSKLLSLIQKDNSHHIIQILTQIGDNPSYEIAQILSNKIYHVLEISWLKSIKLIYTQYINPIKSEPIVKEIFPISIDTLSNNDNNLAGEESSKSIDPSCFEPNPTVILQNSFSIFFEASIYNALANAKLAEMSQRRTAMEQASDNAQDLINELNVQYNSSRQAKITQEITEIINGSN
ncbi:ATP synthase F1 subunit gamma [Metamycoplasma hominis]|uniref:ATP synthase gamma chain n=1 Tax=Metamycoplasma hominis (strain ATCC 23114 / DSM 25592 / NBRC 14850 / NCTC 10111 / PG21) TaxID=347256 RepID=D1J7G5_METH1|nr:ATP synthase F1 subunit gamma [Metamycoplasma hominis]CAX37159.1 ATP synthase gamma chain [Metamycoplasma hominis ATCC 23114]